MLINGNRIDRVSLIIRIITVTLMVLEMNQVIELLRITHRYRQQPAEKSVSRFPFEVRIMYEIVSDSVDVPGDADGVNKTQNQHDPQRSVRKQKEHRNHKSGMVEHRNYRNPVFIGMGQNLHIAFDTITIMVNKKTSNHLPNSSQLIY